MKNLKENLKLPILGLLTLLTLSPVWSQQLWIYPPIDADEATAKLFEEALQLRQRFLYGQARDKYLEVSTMHPGDAIGASALLSAAEIAILAGVSTPENSTTATWSFTVTSPISSEDRGKIESMVPGADP